MPMLIIFLIATAGWLVRVNSFLVQSIDNSAIIANRAVFPLLSAHGKGKNIDVGKVLSDRLEKCELLAVIPISALPLERANSLKSILPVGSYASILSRPRLASVVNRTPFSAVVDELQSAQNYCIFFSGDGQHNMDLLCGWWKDGVKSIKADEASAYQLLMCFKRGVMVNIDTNYFQL